MRGAEFATPPKKCPFGYIDYFKLVIFFKETVECPLNVPPWQADYFELKTIKAQQIPEEMLTSP